MINTRSIQSVFVFRIKDVTFGEKEFLAARLRLRQAFSNAPCSFEFSWWIVTAVESVLNPLLSFHLDVGVVIRQTIESACRHHSSSAIRIKRKEPHAGHTVVMHVSAYVQFVH